MTKGERKVCLSYEERATPGCVCVGDVVLYKHEDRSLRLALVLRIREDRVEVQRLKRRTSATKEVAEGQQAAVDTHAGRYLATIPKRQEDSCEGDMWQVQYFYLYLYLNN